ncbi:MAG TPA: hypothetical protein VF158_03355 [Longimicrobiales bacterium]
MTAPASGRPAEATTPAGPRPHGYARYKLDGCRCYTCALAVSEYNANRARAIAYGTWQPFVDAAPVRAHIEHLRECGIGLRRLAELTGLHRSLLSAITNGRSGKPPASKIRPQTAERILAVEPTLDNIAPKTHVDASGARRRIHALVAIGWPFAQLAHRLGMTGGNLAYMIARQRITAVKARAIRDLYERLWDADPTAHGVTEQAATRARDTARARGWPPPAGWDDDFLDLPDPELRAELRRRAAAMDDREVRACYSAARCGDLSPLVQAGYREYHRRRYRKETTNGTAA